MKPLTLFLAVLSLCVATPGFAKKDSYYLTMETYLGDEVMYACAKGYHFASMWEIRDLSGLSYELKRGYMTDKSMNGPPVELPETGQLHGWLATGVDPDCDAWTNSTDGAGGDGRLGWTGRLDPGEVFSLGSDGWQFEPRECWIPRRVWCKSD